MRRRTGWARVLHWTAALVMVASVLAQMAPPARANELQNNLNNALDRQKYIQEQKKAATNELARLHWELEEAAERLRQAESELALANQRLTALNNLLTEARRDLDHVETELLAATERYELRKAVLGTRIRIINEEGRVNYLAVLLGANTFGDFLSRFDMLKLVVKRDSLLFNEIRDAKGVLEARQQAAIAHRNQIQDLRAQAEFHKGDVESKRAQRQQVSRNLEVSKRRMEEKLDEFERQEQMLAEEIAEIQRQLARAAGRFIPIHPLKRPATITSPFGMRLHPILGVWRGHTGTDFAANTGEPIYAIEDGQVIVARWDDAYGYLTIIDHGGGISSWYAHASKLLTTTGQEVKQGQKIAEVGSTGWSTGPHLHLEIRINGKAEDPMEYIK